MLMQKVRRLRDGSRIAVVAPSWGGPSVFPAVFDLGLTNLRRMGLIPVEFPTARMKNDDLRKNPRLRAEDLHRSFLDPHIDGVIAAIGGDDSVRLLEFLRPEVFRENPKFIMGYSDSTTFLNFIADAGVVTFYGPTVMSGLAQWQFFPPEIQEHFFEMVFRGGTPAWGSNHVFSEGYPDWSDTSRIGQLNPPQQTDGWHWLCGTSNVVREGVLWGGCMEVLEMMKGTRFWPSTWSDKILFLETSESVPSPTAVSYWLRNYGVQGVFSQIKALLIARARGYSVEQKAELEEIVERVVREEFGVDDLLIVTNMDFGHTEPQWVMPIGGKIRLDPTMKTMRLVDAVCE
jgi:muramoyltetrapeptide carboxypeptidase LdcA involved in peptidoglycan recycling